MHEAEQVLAGIPKSHAAPDTGLKVGCGTAHVKGYHTLVLVPDIYHAVQLFLGRGNGKV